MIQLQLSTQGKEVKQLQNKLVQLGYLVIINGIFEKNTENAVKKFQEDNKLKVDGIVGWYTYHKINNLLSLNDDNIAIKKKDRFDWKVIIKWRS